LLACFACDRTHMSASYGQSLRRALAAQVIDPRAGSRPVTDRGLDPEEASAVLEGYRKSLTSSGDTQSSLRTPVLVLPQAQPGLAPAPPPLPPGGSR
jgi:hypothetical protein